MLRVGIPLLTILWLAACSSEDVADPNACGLNGSCPTGYTCDTGSNTCRLTGATDGGGADGPFALDAPGGPPDASRPDAPRPDARPPDAPPGPALLALTPLSLDFGLVTLGDTSLPLTFT